jgi:hypothetical protein
MFLLCERSRADPAYPRYPRLPVVRCAGFQPKADEAPPQAATTDPADRDRGG